MPRKKTAPAVKAIPLALSGGERTLLADELGCWESQLVRRIQETPAGQAVPFSWQELNILTTHIALESLLSGEQKNVRGLHRLYRRLVTTLARHGTKAMSGFEEGARPALHGGVRLSEPERESLIRIARLPPPLRQRLAEVPAGTQFLAFAAAQLAQVRRAIENVLPRAAHPHRKRLQGILERIGEAP
jgi:hypothetical protein